MARIFCHLIISIGFVDLPSVAGLDPSIHDSPSTIPVLTTSTTGTLASLGSI